MNNLFFFFFLDFVDNTTTHFIASSLAGFVATFVTMPFDVIKTRLQNAPSGTYKGMVNCLFVTVKNEGLMSMMRGFFAASVRLVPHTILTFVFLEKYKLFYRMYASRNDM